MATTFSRFQRRGNSAEQPQRKANERVGEILSDSNSELSSVDGGDNESAPAIATTPASTKQASRASRSPSSSSGSGAERRARHRTNNTKRTASSHSSHSASGAQRSQHESSGAKIRQLPAKTSTSLRTRSQQSQSQSHAAQKSRSSSSKKAANRKWYSDSDNDDDDEDKDSDTSVGAGDPVPTIAPLRARSKVKSERRETRNRGKNNTDTDTNAKARPKPSTSSDESDDADLEQHLAGYTTQRNRQSLDIASAPAAATATGSASMTIDPLAKKKSGFQKLVAKTFSPFGSRLKSPETLSGGDDSSAARRSGVARGQSAAAVLSPTTDTSTPRTARSKRQSAAAAEASEASDVLSPLSTADRRRGRAATTTAVPASASMTHQSSDAPLLNRRTSRLKQSPNASELSRSSGPRSLTSSQEAAARRAVEAVAAAAASSSSGAIGALSPGGILSPSADLALSPSQRKLPGAFLGMRGSGVLLEGWLRQKQRRGVKGMKKWNARYFVLYAQTNEVRYYADVVQSAWGPIPLGEIGSIALRLIKKIGKPSHPKYKGCRFDITCRNSWGTHYADDYVSSDDDRDNSGNDDENNASARSNNANASAKAAGAKQQMNAPATAQSSRMYSLVTDSPQTTSMWMTALDSLLVRSVNSPRPDAVAGSTGGRGRGGTGSRATLTLSGVAAAKVLARRQASALASGTRVLVSAGESVPMAVTLAIQYIFDSTPGIETKRFYELEPDAAKLTASLQYLNQFSVSAAHKPTLEELDAVLDVETAGAVVKCWLAQLEHPIVPFAMFDDFQALARTAQTAPFSLTRDLKALIDALPRHNFAMLVCVLEHLNDVHGYASKNHMDAATLARLFADYVLRPRRAETSDEAAAAGGGSDTEAERELSRALVQEMISSVDAIIEE